MTYQHSVQIGPEFFQKVKNDYSNWMWAIIREFIQNGIDAPNTRNNLMFVFGRPKHERPKINARYHFRIRNTFKPPRGKIMAIRNTDDFNTGNRNSGDFNSGNRNSGDFNTGNRNSGNSNTGNFNSGNRNSGNFNTGNRNSGDFNSGNRNSGFFCTQTSPPLFFDQPTELSWKQAFDAIPPVSLPADLPLTEAFPLAWAKMTDKERAQWLSLPNFDAAKFKHITGVDVHQKRHHTGDIRQAFYKASDGAYALQYATPADDKELAVLVAELHAAKNAIADHLDAHYIWD